MAAAIDIIYDAESRIFTIIDIEGEIHTIALFDIPSTLPLIAAPSRENMYAIRNALKSPFTLDVTHTRWILKRDTTKKGTARFDSINKTIHITHAPYIILAEVLTQSDTAEIIPIDYYICLTHNQNTIALSVTQAHKMARGEYTSLQ